MKQRIEKSELFRELGVSFFWKYQILKQIDLLYRPNGSSYNAFDMALKTSEFHHQLVEVEKEIERLIKEIEDYDDDKVV